MNPITKLNRLAESHGELKPGSGMISGVIALSLAILCFLAVLAFHFPAHLTTPELRKSYDVEVLRTVMFIALVIAGGLSLTSLIFGRARWVSLAAFSLVILTVALGGHRVPVGDFPDHTPYLGLDWFILDLLGSTIVFILIEKLFALRDQPVFRAEWQTDFHHFIVNHLLVGFALLVVNKAVNSGFGWAVNADVQAWIRGLPFAIELFLCILVADLAQYATHRAYHEVPWLWRLHAVHHSAKTMDWLAGSRQHVIEVILTRTLVLAPIFVLGFSKPVVDAYILIVGFQAVFNHANVSVRLGPLSYVIVTPNFHHWHHSQDQEALDRNYAAHFAFIDYLFGTAVKADRTWPLRYGVLGDYVPNGFLKQMAFPFTWRDKPAKPPHGAD
ncbi:MAG: sterol desaturase family protein [Betaproteobacteria bacterium]|nr:sterol desaturase family protein [Betaproteobacteria bacterium]